MDTGQLAAIWLARIAAALYVAALFRKSRSLWTTALAAYLLHVVFAFQYFYHWSHSRALTETARQTKALFGVDSGAGLYLNYLFTAEWMVDCIWWWCNAEGYRARPAFVHRAIHVFLAFMFLNATIVVWISRMVH